MQYLQFLFIYFYYTNVLFFFNSFLFQFPLPLPKGGKYAKNPILFEDQKEAQKRASKLARQKNNPLDDDYIAG